MPKGRRKKLEARAKVVTSSYQESVIQKTDDVLAGGKVSEKPAAALYAVEKKKAKRT